MQNNSLTDTTDWDQAFGMLSTVEVNPAVSFALTSDKAYRALMLHRNITSYSQLTTLHACPRKYLLDKHAGGFDSSNPFQQNLDFAFGHSVGAGVQSYCMTRSVEAAYLNAWLAWSAQMEERDDKRCKSVWEALLAVQSFIGIYDAGLSQEWEIATLQGRPAVEIAFRIDTKNGYHHYGHIDLVMRHRKKGQLAVFELKTTSLGGAEEAVYSNSSQSIGYSLVIQAAAPEQTSYIVYYWVWQSKERTWACMPFEKSVESRTEWLRDLLLDHETLDRYHQLKFYPKRGESCFDYTKRCQYYGECDIVSNLPELAETEADLEAIDYSFSLDQLIGVLNEAG